MTAKKAVEIAATKEIMMPAAVEGGSINISTVQNESPGKIIGAEEAVEIAVADEVTTGATEGGSTDIIMLQHDKENTPPAKEMPNDNTLEVVVTDEVLGIDVGGSAEDMKMNNVTSKCRAELDDDVCDDPRAASENGSFSSHTDVLHTIFEIAGVDSSGGDSLPDNLKQHLENEPPAVPTPSHLSIESPVGVVLRSQRRTKLTKAGANSDFEMKQLDQQIALTNQYTSEVVAMRREQTKLKEQLEHEREEIALSNKRLLRDLQGLQEMATQISQAEAEVAILAQEYNFQLHLLEQEREQMRLYLMGAMQPTISNQNGFYTMPEMNPFIGNHDEMDANEMILQAAAAAARHTLGENESTALIAHGAQPVPMAECKTNHGSNTMEKEEVFHYSMETHMPNVNDNGMDANEMIHQVTAAARLSSGKIEKPATDITNGVESHSEPMAHMVKCQTKDRPSIPRKEKAPRYSKGMRVYYSNASTNETNSPAIVLDVHQDDPSEPYYTIWLEDGREKQTDTGHLQLMDHTGSADGSPQSIPSVVEFSGAYQPFMEPFDGNTRRTTVGLAR